ncbi:KpsF/GutQ family sugar-phosphate isomerase [Sphingomonas sp. PB4P5]|uniref:KpsF/GutQ family sugar-phosphate isomerase n=1 Tax=Parasphingomonas puruogangriensis TaxID=3096155 RepID=UPI003FA77377
MMLQAADDTIRIEREALVALEQALEQTPLRSAFGQAFDAILAMRGRVIATGIGKSGLVARKIAATLMSTGTPSAYLHPGEANHGDLGMITADDVVLALSWSGETPELAEIIHHAHRLGVPLIVATSNAESAAGRAADICLALPAVREACPHQLAPTASTTVQAAMGDALAVALIRRRGFGVSDFRQLHPGGRLGAKLATVAQLMATGDAVPVIAQHATLMEATVEMSRKRYGCTAVIDDAGQMVGVFTDGDLRRSFANSRNDAPVGEHMTPGPLTISSDTLSSEALRIMNAHTVTALFICDDAKPIGVIHLHDVLRAGVG